MTQAILEADQIPTQNLAIIPILAPAPIAVYQKRAERLAKLAIDSPMVDYLTLLEQLVNMQVSLAKNADFDAMPSFVSGQEMPFSIEHCGDNQYWQVLLLELISGLLPVVSEQIAEVLQTLGQLEHAILADYGNALRRGEFSRVPAQYSLFIWAAMSVYWSHWAAKPIPELTHQVTDHKQLCPVCGSHPVASMIKDKPRTGLRYLHCSLCETEWHMVRAACTVCDKDDKIYLWAEQEKQASVRIESCDHCHGYTKMLFTDIDPSLEAAVDDLATMYFDQNMVEQGFTATTVNPFVLAHEQ